MTEAGMVQLPLDIDPELPRDIKEKGGWGGTRGTQRPMRRASREAQGAQHKVTCETQSDVRNRKRRAEQKASCGTESDISRLRNRK